MKYQNLIPNHTPVSQVGLGAWQLAENSGWRSISEKEAITIVETAWDHGVNFFDTAPNYGHGSGESRLGKALKSKDRDKVVISTKFGHTDSGNLNFNSDYIRTSLHGSLKRLQLDYVDALLFHNPPSDYLDGNKNDHYEILERLKEEGKIKSYGASLDTAADMKLLMDTTSSQVIEAFFNILWQDVRQAFDLAQENEVGIIAKVPLDSGWLSGKYTSESSFDDIRSRWSKKDIKTRAKLTERIREIIGREKNLPQQAIAFCNAYEAVSTVIPGSSTLEQLLSNIKSTQIHLPKTKLKELEQFYDNEVRALNIPW